MRNLIFFLLIFAFDLDAEDMWKPSQNPFREPLGYVIPNVQIESYYGCPEETIGENDEKPLKTTSYTLKPGDRLSLEVYGEATTRRVVDVDLTGSISYLYINGYVVHGKTLDDIRTDLQVKLSTYFRQPILMMTLLDSLGEYYTVLGAVNGPGNKILTGNATVLSALSQAGGFRIREFREELGDMADLEHAFLARNGDYVSVDFERLVKYGDLSQNVRLQRGDYIFIPTKETKEIYVLGEVIAPLTISYFRTRTVAEAIAEAGGVTPRASSRVAVIRGSLACPTHYLVDVNRIWKGNACDFFLQPGDIVYVPPMKFSTVKEILKNGIRSFVSTFASIAGYRAYINLNPDASNIAEPVPFINTSAPVAPVIP